MDLELANFAKRDGWTDGWTDGQTGLKRCLGTSKNRLQFDLLGNGYDSWSNIHYHENSFGKDKKV